MSHQLRIAFSRQAAIVLLGLMPVLNARAEERFEWQRATPEEAGMDRGKLEEARDYVVLKREDPHRGGSGFITRDGKVVMAWGSPTELYQVKSVTKSIGISALGLAILDGRMTLGDKASQYHPGFGVPPTSNRATGWLGEITLQQLATHTAGFDLAHGFQPLLFAPGTKWSYSDGGSNWLAECITLEYLQDIKTLLFNRVFSPLGITESDLTWRDSYYRPDKIEGIKRRELGSGIRANVDALARIGYLFALDGRWEGTQILPKGFVDAVRTTPPELFGLPVLNPDDNPEASNHYGLLWWNNSDGTLPNVPRDAFWAWGGQVTRDTETLLVVIPSLGIVAARAGTGPGDGTSDYRFLEPFIRPIAESVRAEDRKER